MRLVVFALFLLLAGCIDPALEGTDSHAMAAARPSAPETRSTGAPDRSESDIAVTQSIGVPVRFHAEQTVTYRNDVVADVATVLIDTYGGDITVTPSDKAEYTLELVLHGDGDTEMEARNNLAALQESHTEATGLTLSTVITNNGGMRNGADVTMVMPRMFLDRLTLDTGSGDVELGAFTGDVLAIDTGSGDHSVAGVVFDSAELDAGSGDITVSATIGDLSVDTGSGEQDLTLKAGRSATWSLDAGSGDITLRASGGAYDVEADNGSGDIDLSFSGSSAIGEQDDDHKHVRSSGYSGAAVQVAIDMGSSSGDIEASG